MADSGAMQGTERLWTPWRMSYVGGSTKEEGCIFCNRLNRDSDIVSLILYRARHTFVIMNLYPYNTGHIMLVPNQHASDPAELAPEALAETGTMLPTLTNALRRAFGCHGFNVGLNIGAIAGAGVEAHLHEHIVPRWQGDANFMPILASTMTIPELIPVTYAKIRAEITRELTGATSARAVVLDARTDRVLLRGGELPDALFSVDEPVVQGLAGELPHELAQIELAGWAGPDRSDNPQPDDIALTFRARVNAETLPTPWTFEPVAAVDDTDARQLAEQALDQLAPGV